MLQNIGTQTHESTLIQQNQPKSNTNSIQGKQCTSSETQTCEEGRKRKEKKKSYPDVKREKSYLDVKKEERKRKKEKEKRVTQM